MLLCSGRNQPTESENNRPSPQPSKEPGETSSVTEDDNDSEDDSDSRDAQYRCSHCFTTSKLCEVYLLEFPLNIFFKIHS